MTIDLELENAFVRFAMREKLMLDDPFVEIVTYEVWRNGDKPCLLCGCPMRQHVLAVLYGRIMTHRFVQE